MTTAFASPSSFRVLASSETVSYCAFQPFRTLVIPCQSLRSRTTLRMKAVSNAPAENEDELQQLKSNNEGESDSEIEPKQGVNTDDQDSSISYTGPFGLVKRLIANRNQLKASTLRNYGIAAFISYGFFDALTYSISFLLSLRAYIAAGKTLTRETLPQVLAFMWGINNLSRPFRIAGAVALAPIVDKRIVKPVSAFFSRLRQKSQTDDSDSST